MPPCAVIKRDRDVRLIQFCPNLGLNHGSALGCAGTALLAPFIPSPPLPLFLWISLREKKSGEKGGRHPPSSFSLPSRCLHGACQGGKNGALLFIVTVAVKKKALLYLLAPLSAHPSSIKRMKRKGAVLPLWSSTSLTPLIILSSVYPAIPLVCLYHCLDAFSRGCIIHFSSRVVAQQSWMESGRGGEGKEWAWRRGEGNKEAVRGGNASCCASQVGFV